MSMKSEAEEYFSKMNSIANRMCVDMNEAKSSYDKLWNELSDEEKEQILNETIIKPEILLKYDTREKECRNEQYGLKLVVDDNCSYRDEHSAPFTFRTKSQRDLTIFEKPVKAVVKTPKEYSKPKVKLDEDTVAVSPIIPRTGLDLLDNW